MKTLAPRSSWLITIGLVVVSVGYLYFVFMPARRGIEKLREELSQKQAYLAQQPGLKSSLASVESELGHTQEYVDQWRSHAPAAGELSSTYGAIHRLVTSAGVEVEKFDPQNVTSLETVRKIPIRLTAEGSFAQMHALLRGLEEMPASPWVESLRIERGKDAEAPLKGEITLVIFAANPEISD
ncbi:MAG: type 4a pilus biogenesis protein PilO [Planctomycetes bacterium]|nr:type 4a pilus biogenesis protein PilO [Planctomycetota bacterium]